MAKALKTIDFSDGTQGVLARDLPRLGGFLIDSILVGLVSEFIARGAWSYLGAALLLAIYCTVMVATTGTTLGGRAVGIHAVDAKSGKKLSWAQSAKRGLGYFVVLLPASLAQYWSQTHLIIHHAVLQLSGSTAFVATTKSYSSVDLVLMLVGGILSAAGLLWVGIDKQKRTWYDIFAKTVVVELP